MNLKPLLKYQNMTVRQLAVIMLLGNEPENKLLYRKIAIRLKVPKPSLTRAFDALVEIKLIKRYRSEDDGRDVFGELTELGKAMCNEVTKNEIVQRA